MNDSRIQKYILYGDLASGKRTTCHPRLQYKDVCMADMKAHLLVLCCQYTGQHSWWSQTSWEGLAADRTRWRSTLNQHLKTGEDNLMNTAEDKRISRKEHSNSSRPVSTLRCDLSCTICLSRIRLFSHRRRCPNRADSQNSKDTSAMTKGAYYILCCTWREMMNMFR